ncbi:hypothetical protein WB401_43880 [Streptomyces brasiliscabiei]|uniref:Uncharacterized protein n=1 Tax=Streptomyces brasiliscabiei TaxID=2736302 RepID=A0ABU8GVU5_9ACTN
MTSRRLDGRRHEIAGEARGWSWSWGELARRRAVPTAPGRGSRTARCRAARPLPT